MRLVLHYYKSIVDGVMTTMIDLYNNLKIIKGNDEVNIKIICPELYLLDDEEEKNIYFPKIDLNNIKYYKYKETKNLDICRKEVQYPETFNQLQKNEVTCKIPFLQLNRNFGDIYLSKCLTYLPCKF